jgi:hypothetical protein
MCGDGNRHGTDRTRARGHRCSGAGSSQNQNYDVNGMRANRTFMRLQWRRCLGVRLPTACAGRIRAHLACRHWMTGAGVRAVISQSAPDSSKGAPTDPDAPVSGIRLLGFTVGSEKLRRIIESSPRSWPSGTPPAPGFILRADRVSEPLIPGLHGSAAFHRNIALYDHDGSCHPH